MLYVNCYELEESTETNGDRVALVVMERPLASVPVEDERTAETEKSRISKLFSGRNIDITVEPFVAESHYAVNELR